MTKHVHEWEQWDEKIGWYSCKNQPCHLLLSPEQTLDRLNATERLSAETVRQLLLAISCKPKHYDALRAYANILEGNDDGSI